MRGALRLYWAYVSVSLRAQLQYRASFVMMTLGHALLTAFEFLGIWVLFDRFGALPGWSLPEVALLYGLVNTGFALSEGLARGFDTFPGLIKSGDFDRLLLRPRSTVFQVAAREVQVMRFGRLAQGLVILLWAAGRLEVEWTAARCALAAAAVCGGACLFSGLFVLQATVAFWTVESLEIMNITTYGGSEAVQFPVTIYRPWLRNVLIFAVPLACVTYFPALALLGREDPFGTPVLFQWCAPLIGVLFLLLCLQVWKFGVRRYCSTGS